MDFDSKAKDDNADFLACSLLGLKQTGRLFLWIICGAGYAQGEGAFGSQEQFPIC